MKFGKALAFTLFLCLNSTQAQEAELLSWTRAADQKSLEASFVAYDAESDKLSLKLANGNEVTIDGAVLILEHIERVKEIVAERAAAEKKRAEELAAKKKAAEQPRSLTVTPEGGGGHDILIYKPAGYLD